jgi:predicted enzyme related to lactoylglutathione lyase
MKNALNWFEIPTQDIDRATRFYEQVLGAPLKRERFEGIEIAMFPSDQAGVGGALVRDPRRQPGPGGSIVYLAANGQLDACLGRTAKAGGEVVLPRTDIGEPGFIALVKDTEGNVIGLHAPR